MQIHYYRADFLGMDALLARHIESIEALDNPRLRGMALAWYGWVSTMRYDLVAAAARLGMARRLGEEHGLPEVIAYAETWSVWMHVFAGRPREALRSARSRRGCGKPACRSSLRDSEEPRRRRIRQCLRWGLRRGNAGS